MATQCPKCQSENSDTAKFCSECATPLQPTKDIGVTRTIETSVGEFTRGTLFAERYEIIEELGKGGMGNVYRVEDTKTKEEIALKLIKPEIASDKNTIDRFRNELTTARKIRHLNVCGMYDLGEHEGTHFITMEYVSGQDLKGLIRQTGQLAVGTAINIAKQICDGLSEAHKLGVVHRDLKPSNIMINKEGDVRIMDFGIARSLKAKGITRAGAIIGTPDYISPEQVDGKDVDQRADIYSLGVILYEMVTGRVPFEGDSPLSIAYKHKHDAPQDPRKINTQIPDDLNHLILKCLEKDKENRYQSSSELGSELENIEKGIPTTERATPGRRPLTSREITLQFSLKKLLIPALVVGVLVIAVAMVIWQPWSQKTLVIAPKIENSIAVISFQNQTGDSAFDYLQKVIPNLLITNLENTGLFHVVTWERMHDLLKQIGKNNVETIDGDLGFEVCRLEGIRAIVLGFFTKAGDVFNTDIKVLDTETKKILKSYISKGEGIDSILKTQIDELSKEISQSMSREKIEAPQVQISEITTTSMEAYNYFMKGRREYEKFYNDEARLNLEKAIEHDPVFAVAYLYLGYTYSQMRYVAESHKAYEKAMVFSSNASDKEKYYIRAQYASSIEKDPEKRFQILEEAIGKYPKEKRLHYLLGSYYRGKKMYPEAEQELQQALKLDPQYGTAINTLASNYLDMGNFEKAIEFFKRYAAAFPEEANPLDSIGDLYFRMGRLDEAIAKFKEALEIKPDFGSELEIAYIYALKEDYTETIRWLDHLVDVAPSPGLKGQGVWFRGIYNNWLGRRKQFENDFSQLDELWKAAGNRYGKAIMDMTRGWIYYDQGEWELSRKYYDLYFHFIKDYEPQYLVWNTAYQREFLGMLDIKQGRIDSARSNLEEVNKLRPEMLEQRPVWTSQARTTVIIFEAELILAEGRIQEAIEFLENSPPKEAPQMTLPQLIQHNLPFQQDLLAQAYYKTGALDKAIAEYERLITFDPESGDRCLIHPLYYYRLAGLCIEKGWEGKAIEHYEKFLSLWNDADPGIAEVEDAKKRLAGLKSH